MLKQLAAELLTLYNNDTPTFICSNAIKLLARLRDDFGLAAACASSFSLDTIVCWLRDSLLKVSNLIVYSVTRSVTATTV